MTEQNAAMTLPGEECNLAMADDDECEDRALAVACSELLSHASDSLM